MIICVNCHGKPEEPVAQTYVDEAAFVRIQEGWLELRWGLAQRAMFCTQECLLEFYREGGMLKGKGVIR